MTDSQHQIIEFGGSEERTFAELTSLSNVVIESRPGDHELGCSNITLKDLINFTWEKKYYNGHIIAVHMSGKVIAYGISTKGGGMIRLTTKGAIIRGLIKGLVGQPQDLAFAHIESEVLLASIDEGGNMFIHSIQIQDLKHDLILYIPCDTQASIHRVIWCPYIPEQDEIEDDIIRLLVVIHGSKAVMMCVRTIIECYGKEPLANGLCTVLKEGVIEISEFAKPITDATFSPDGTAIALASCDGQVKFFQVYMHAAEAKNEPRCLHHWKPHDGKAVSSLFFLDNHKCRHPDVQYWKYAITGCDNNSELKLWSCESWACLQKIVIQPHSSVAHLSEHLSLKICLDKTAEYLFLSDVYNRIFYIIHLKQDDGKTGVYMKSISELLLPCSILSFDIAKIDPLYCKNSNNGHDGFDDFDHDEMDANVNDVMDEISGPGFDQYRKSNGSVMMKLFVVQPKSLQLCKVLFDPQVYHGAAVTKHLGKSNFGFGDDLSTVSNHTEKSISSSIEEKNIQSLNELVNNSSEFKTLPMQQSTPLHMVQPPALPTPINLMTPEAFNTMTNDSKTSGEHTLKAFDGSILEAKVSGSPSLMDKKFIDDLMYLGTNRLEEIEPPMATSENLEYDEKPHNANFASGGSSPSREVQEILSLKDSRSNLLDFDITDDGVQETTTQTIKPLVTKSLNSSEAKLEGNKLDGGWPSPPKLDAKPAVEDSLNNGNTSSNSIGATNKAFASYSSANNISVEDDSKTPTLEKILCTLVQQTKQIEDLQKEIKQLHENETQTHRAYVENSSSNMHSFMANVEKMMDHAFVKNQVHQSKLMETLSNRVSDEAGDMNHMVTQSIENLLDKHFLEKFSSNFTMEMQHFIVPSVVSSLDGLKLAVQNDIATKLSATDDLLRDHVMKFTQDKHTIELLSKALLVGAQTTLTNTLKEYMANSLIPSFERAANQMFKQMHETFLQGTKDYVMNFEMSMEKRRHVDKSKEIVVHMDQLNENLRVHTQATNAINKNMYESISKTMKLMQDNLIKSINENVNMAFRKQSEELEDHLKIAVRSNAVTPSVQVNDAASYRAQINDLLLQNDLSGAFQTALMASDLSVVVYLCEKVDPRTMFKQSPCPLQQNVLLSLIQQLGADLLNHTELKYRYLEEALMNLETNNSGLEEHLLLILKDLKKQLTSFINQHPNNALTKSIRMLSMVTDSLLNTASLNFTISSTNTTH